MDQSGFALLFLLPISAALDGPNASTALPQSVQQLGIPVGSPPQDYGHLRISSVQEGLWSFSGFKC